MTGSRRRKLGRLGDNVPAEDEPTESGGQRHAAEAASGSIVIPDSVAKKRDTAPPPLEGPSLRRQRLGIDEDLR